MTFALSCKIASPGPIVLTIPQAFDSFSTGRPYSGRDIARKEDEWKMKLSRTVAYAVHATLRLAQSNSVTPVPCSQLASEGKMPERFLLQILRHLVNHGILQSTRGVDGGYMLERKPTEISLLDVIEAIDGPLSTTLPGSDGVEVSQCELNLRDALEQVTSSSRRQLEAIKLSDLLASHALAKMALVTATCHGFRLSSQDPARGVLGGRAKASIRVSREVLIFAPWHLALAAWPV
jgi:Rrf2 family protein